MTRACLVPSSAFFGILAPSPGFAFSTYIIYYTPLFNSVYIISSISMLYFSHLLLFFEDRIFSAVLDIDMLFFAASCLLCLPLHFIFVIRAGFRSSFVKVYALYIGWYIRAKRPI